MKRFFRRTLLILLALALPAYGWASVAIAAPCTMPQQVVAHDQHRCCSHQHGKPLQTQTCKTDQECQSSVCYISAAATLSAAPSPQSVVISPRSHFTSPIIDAVWRPPLHS